MDDLELVSKKTITVYSFPVITVILIIINICVFFGHELLAFGYAKPTQPFISCLKSTHSECLTRASEQSYLECSKDVILNNPKFVKTDLESCLYDISSVCESNLDSVYSCLSPRQQFYYEYAFTPKLFESGQKLWTIFTSMFIHGDWSHLVNNMFSLFLAGTFIEIRLNSRVRYLLFYLLTGIAASLFYYFFNQGSITPALGASGAIFGLLGANLVLKKDKNDFDYTPRFLENSSFRGFSTHYLVLVFALQIFGTLSDSNGIAYTAHIGGFIAGIILIYCIHTKRHK